MTLAPQQRLAAALALALSLAVASPAAASTASVQGDTVVFAADPGETNAVNVGVDSAGIYIRDTGAVLAAGAGCTIDSHREVTCARGGVARLNVTLGDGDDRLLGSAASGQDLFVTADGGAGSDQLKAENAGSTLDGGAGADTLTGGNGADHLIGGAGQDTLQGGDGADVLDAADADLSDLVDCGAGDDSARVDPAPSGVQAEDATACETVERPAPQVGGWIDFGLNFTALPGVANDVTFTARPDTMDSLITDARGIGITSGCDHDGADLTSVVCGSTARGEFNLGDGNDRFRGTAANVTAGSGDDVVTVSGSDSSIDGGAGNDTLTGLDGDQDIKGGFGNDTITDRGGADVLWGGLGNDVLSARDGTRDSLLCESGKDRATADWLDYVWKCEKYKRGDTSPPAAFAATTKVRKLATFQHKTPNGFFPLVHVPVSCPAGASAGCAVTLAVYFRSERRGDVPFRHDPIVIPGGATRTVDLLGESAGLEAAFRGGAKIPTLIAIVTTDDRLHTKTTLHPVVMKGTSKRG